MEHFATHHAGQAMEAMALFAGNNAPRVNMNAVLYAQTLQILALIQ